MNLLCPNCQKPLTVPDQYAGQLMKCPLCNGTFSVPGLAPPSAPPPPPPSQPDVFQVSPEPPPPSPRQEPARSRRDATPAPPPPPPPPTSGYQRTFSLTLNPKAAAWVAPAAIVLIFVLLFFPWVSTYLTDGNQWYSQLGWGTGFGSQRSFLGILYILLLFPTLFVAIALAVVPLLPIKLPPQLAPLLPWRSAAVAAVVLLPTLFLAAQCLLFGFGLENTVLTTGDGPKSEKPGDTLEDKLRARETTRTVARATLDRSLWPYLAGVLHLIALAGCGIDLWLERRGPSLPPRMDLLW